MALHHSEKVWLHFYPPNGFELKDWKPSRILHHSAGEPGEACRRGVRPEHHLRCGQLSTQAGVHHLLPQQQGERCQDMIRDHLHLPDHYQYTG